MAFKKDNEASARGGGSNSVEPLMKYEKWLKMRLTSVRVGAQNSKQIWLRNDAKYGQKRGNR